MTTLVRPEQRDDDDLEGLRSHAAEAEARLGERRAEATLLKSGLDQFRISYRQRVGLLHEQIDTLASDLAALSDSPLWKLKAMVDEAAAKGKDLVREMVSRLKRDIMAATNRLDAMRPPPR